MARLLQSPLFDAAQALSGLDFYLPSFHQESAFERFTRPPAGPGWGWGCAGLKERGSEFLEASCFNWEASLSRRAGSLGTTTQGGECLASKRQIMEDKK